MVKRVRLSKPVKRRRKKNISIPLNENTLESLEEWAGEFGLTKTELAREAVKFALKSKKFLSLMS